MDYIAEMSAELAGIAEQRGSDFLAYLLRMAADHAQSESAAFGAPQSGIELPRSPVAMESRRR